MTPELIAILAVGVALAGLMLQGQRGLGARIDGLDARMARLEARMDGLDARMDRFETRFDALAEEMREVRDRLSRLEGKMDFLEGYIVRRNEPEPAAE
ncbi:MAG: hypothetical protein OYH76_07765 [Defluviicoccus sp.]|nr:hypothetical protein [Defluviicoccus sp.]MDE0275776.1 hypothetical protein [Defluviicoccus sp.]